MAELDFSDVIEDPDFSDVFSVYRIADAVGTNGRSTRTETQVPGLTGVLYFEADQTAVGEGALLPNRQLIVVTQYRLRDASAGVLPDEVFYDGNRYTVTTCVPWHRYGQGWVRATCTLKKAVVPPVN